MISADNTAPKVKAKPATPAKETKDAQAQAAAAAPAKATMATAKKNPTRVLIVDDHPLLRRGVGQLINNEKDMTVCGEAEDAHKALTAINDSKPDIAVIDVSLGGTSGIELLKNIKVRWP